MPTRNAPVEKVFVVVLSCKHVMFYTTPKPGFGDRVYCSKCMRWPAVVSTYETWRYYCLSCRSGYQYGADKQTALRRGLGHQRSYPAHVIWISGPGVNERLSAPQDPLPIVTRT